MREIKFRQILENRNGVITWMYWGYIGKNGFFTGPNLLNTPSYQYAGLRDKNDKEIYEGDIIKSKKNVYEVKYENGSYLLFPKKPYFVYLSGFTSSQIEVIGNIYTTPDLLI